ncbi:SDR family NAD(P)-dependent oxidoreductase [Streptomyces sp. NPDC093097]|uniref:SDR family NAD(P)-dependent oxidoreductase n=1 Tax=Streptomyces sp. NPDC093097 TaxID=3366027 RepID=UPI0037F3A057
MAVTYHSGKDAAEETAEQVAALGGTPLVVRYDLDDEQAIREAVGQVGSAWGGIDVLVLNAVVWGDAIPRPGRPQPPFEEVPASQWQETLRTSVDAVVTPRRS